uniref:RNA polymerase II subunit A C-terminal domain phosphatase n=1 Tax=Globisporangium ultimum (strain ATCC 200006 / CBS 805.95 / DAOM BR144) TaxID=431595 RepID=K3WRP9_GLOUD
MASAVDAPPLAEHLRRKDVACARALLESIAWNVSDGAEVDAGQVMGSVGLIERGNLQQLIAPCRGKLRICPQQQANANGVVAAVVVVSNGASTANGHEEEGDDGGSNADAAAQKPAPVGSEDCKPSVVAFVEYCIHPLKSGRTCMMCLEVVDENEEDIDGERRSVNVVSHGQVLRLNIEEAKKFDSDNIKRQLSAKKLSLVLDLDHTLLHAVRAADVVGEVPKTEDTHFFFIPGMHNQQHVVKLRPGLSTFLRELSVLYDLFIYTHGTRLYAEQIASIIDPKGTFFQHRIVARTDTPEMGHKSLKLLFPSSDDKMILVLDDRIDVWKENEGNVFLIEPYHYFKCTAEINNAAGKGIGGGDDLGSSPDGDTHLIHTSSVLKQVHSKFYEDHEDGKGVTVEEQMAGNGRDVKEILGQQKRSVLKDCNIVFSGVFPIGGHRGPESHYLWRLAVDLGATPSMSMNGFPITHLVIHPGRLGTQKHVQAKAMPGVFVVTPEWIFKCARIWERAPEKDFLADEWKAKQEQAAKATQEAAEAERLAAEASKVPPVSTEPKVGVESNEAKSEPEQIQASGDDDDAQKDRVPETQSPSDNPDAVAKKKKNVSFAASVEGGDEETKEGEDARPGSHSRSLSGASSLRQRRVPVRRVLGGGRVGSSVIPERKGVVASGGTFDFLSKITQIGAAKRDQKPVESAVKQPVQTSKPATKPEPAKDVDDAFLRLIEAEERENEDELKRKLDSDDVKDQLSVRRLKKAKAAADSAVSAARSASEDDGDEDLDDLEADILGDL